eukprot:4674360-Amphidinium_carterae.1
MPKHAKKPSHPRHEDWWHRPKSTALIQCRTGPATPLPRCNSCIVSLTKESLGAHILFGWVSIETLTQYQLGET